MKTFRIQYCIVAVLILFMVGSCTTTSTGSSGKKIDASIVQTIEKGKTTRWQLTDKLGPPKSVTLTADGKRVLMYVYTEVNTKTSVVPLVYSAESKVDYRQQMLQIICDKYGIVEDFVFNDITP